MDKWTTIDEGYPTKEGAYLVTIRDRKMNYLDIASFCSSPSRLEFRKFKQPCFYGITHDLEYYAINNVIAWTELPNAYKEN